jgi:ABC-type phosphate transport system substrate-binding protein
MSIKETIMKKSIAISAIALSVVLLAACGNEAKAEEARGNNSFMGDGSSRMDSDTKGQATFSMSFTGTVDQATQLFGRGSTQNLTNTKAEVEDDK